MKLEERESLRAQAVRGHGVWLALFVPRPIKAHPLSDYLPENAHVTLGYYRAKNPTALADAACETVRVVRDLWFKHSAVKGIVTGAGWFWRKSAPTCVGLVNGVTDLAQDVRSWMRLHMKEECADPLPDEYDFIPHLTLSAAEEAMIHLTRAKPLDIWFPTINVVCGDVRL